MYGVVVCSKFNRKTIRVVDFGDVSGVDEMKKIINSMGDQECPICGPVSHFEFSFGGFYTVFSVHHEKYQAAFQAWQTVDINGEALYDTSKLPSREEVDEALAAEHASPSA